MKIKCLLNKFKNIRRIGWAIPIVTSPVFIGFFTMSNPPTILGIIVALLTILSIGFISSKKEIIFDEALQVATIKERKPFQLIPKKEEIPFSELKDISLHKEKRKIGSTKQGRPIYADFYTVKGAIPGLELYTFKKDELKARRKAERLVRLLQVNLKRLTGEVVSYNQLNQPLGKKLPLETLQKEKKIPERTQIEAEEQGLEYIIKSTYRDMSHLSAAVVFLIISGISSIFFKSILPLIALGGILGLLSFSIFIKKYFFTPHEISIDDKEVSFGKKKIPLKKVEELYIQDKKLRIISDDKIIDVKDFSQTKGDLEWIENELKKKLVLYT